MHSYLGGNNTCLICKEYIEPNLPESQSYLGTLFDDLSLSRTIRNGLSSFNLGWQ